MRSNGTQTSPADDELPSSEVRGIVGLLLFIHLFTVTVALTSYVFPSALQARLLQVFGLYSATLNFDLAPNVYPAGRLYLTYGDTFSEVGDVDFSIEIDATLPDGAVDKITIPAPGLWPGDRRHYQALANAAGAMATSEDVEPVLLRSIAASDPETWEPTKGLASGWLPYLMSAKRATRPMPTSAIRWPREITPRSMKLTCWSRQPDRSTWSSGRRPARSLRLRRRGLSRMMTAVIDYFRTLGRAFGDGWNRFWFLPSDSYPLGVIRVFTGLIAIWLHATMFPDLGRLFAAGGWLPVEAVARTTSRGYPWSYLNYGSSLTDLMIMHGLGLAVLVLFTLGIWTRLTSILAFLVVLSNVHRAPMITSQVEPIVTMVLFYL